MTWSKLWSAISSVIPGLIQTYLVPIILGAAGLAGGFWTWLVGLGAGWLWSKADKEVTTAARVEDQKNTDDAINQKYQEDLKKDGTPESVLVQDELAVLRGNP